MDIRFSLLKCGLKKLLLDFNNYAEYSVASKMAEDPQQVMDFLTDLAEKAFPQAKVEFEELIEDPQAHNKADTFY